MARVCQQAVGYVDAGSGVAKQFLPQSEPCCGTIEALQQQLRMIGAGLPLPPQISQRTRCITQVSRHINVISHLGTGAQHCAIGRQRSHHLDGYRQRASRGVAPDER